MRTSLGPEWRLSTLILSRQVSLESFLSTASDILVPEVCVGESSLCIPVSDLSRLNGQARVHLRASNGRIVQDPADQHGLRHCVSWDLASATSGHRAG